MTLRSSFGTPRFGGSDVSPSWRWVGAARSRLARRSLERRALLGLGVWTLGVSAVPGGWGVGLAAGLASCYAATEYRVGVRARRSLALVTSDPRASDDVHGSQSLGLRGYGSNSAGCGNRPSRYPGGRFLWACLLGVLRGRSLRDGMVAKVRCTFSGWCWSLLRPGPLPRMRRRFFRVMHRYYLPTCKQCLAVSGPYSSRSYYCVSASGLWNGTSTIAVASRSLINSPSSDRAAGDD